MHKNNIKFKILTATALIFVLFAGFLMQGCEALFGNNRTTTTKPSVDPFYTEGYTKGEVEKTDAVTDLIYGVLRRLEQLSPDNIGMNKSAQISAEINLNGEKLNADLRLNHSSQNLNNNALSLILTRGAGTPFISLYQYKEANGTSLYLDIGENNNKILLDMGSEFWFFPYNFEMPEVMILNALAGIVTLKQATNIKYEYKENATGLVSRHYYLEIDLLKTLQEFLDIAGWLNPDLINMEAINTLFINLLGVSNEQIKKGEFPNSTLKVEFFTEEGRTDRFTNGKLKSLNLELDVEAGADSIFMGTRYNLKLNIKSINVYTTLAPVPIVSKATLNNQGYVNYMETDFKVTAKAKYEGLSDIIYDLLIDFRFDYDNPEDAFISLSIENPDGGAKAFFVEYDSGKLTFEFEKTSAQQSSDLVFIYEDFDIILFAQAINAEFEKRNGGMFEMLTYILGALKFGDMENISFVFNPINFYAFSNLNHTALLNALTIGAGLDIEKDFESRGLYFIDIFNRELHIIVNTNDTFFSVQN
ncbi:MAG: hypothetical protein FWD49_05670 [Firmicutes bacterium]|nr:hypothetical protein [Bacillota bacterium]